MANIQESPEKVSEEDRVKNKNADEDHEYASKIWDSSKILLNELKSRAKESSFHNGLISYTQDLKDLKDVYGMLVNFVLSLLFKGYQEVVVFRDLITEKQIHPPTTSSMTEILYKTPIPDNYKMLKAMMERNQNAKRNNELNKRKRQSKAEEESRRNKTPGGGSSSSLPSKDLFNNNFSNDTSNERSNYNHHSDSDNNEDYIEEGFNLTNDYNNSFYNNATTAIRYSTSSYK